jgi:hypothetical protein
MVAHNSNNSNSNNNSNNNITMTTTADRLTKVFSKKKRKDSLRWRSTGWTPLAYPASSLIINASSYDSISVTDSTEVNPFFPLDKDVLRAAMREMLILDGSICADTLKLKQGRTRRFRKSSDSQMNGSETCFAVGPPYVSHMDPTKWNPVKEDPITIRAETIVAENAVNTESKRKLPSSIFVAKKKQKKRDIPAVAADDKGSKSVPPVDECTSMDAHLEEIPLSVSCAELLVDKVLDRARQQRDDAYVVEPVLSAEVQELIVSDSQERPPRKVSDLDDQPPVLLDLTEETCGEHDISLFVDIVNRKKDGKVTFLKHEIPSFLDVSIVFESSLRNVAYRMVSHICDSCDIEALRLFLGYKSCALKRERILRILSDYLFDVSHAMFAWKQTESEILSERTGTALPSIASFYQQIDSLVRDSLFDGRALKKIGGLDDSSILRHAIEISRSERRKEPWERFAKTASGRRLLSHHRSGRAYLVGQKRRGQRIKRFSSAASATDTSEEGQRSRASSIASYDEVENTANTTTKASVPEYPAPAQELTIASATIQNLSEFLEITLTREVDKSWGVLLAREGDMCVVDRAPEKSGVRCGDMILSVKNDRGETATPPASCHTNGTIANPNWFKDTVNVFKGSNELHLVVRRVGC